MALSNVLFEQWDKTCSFSAVRDATISIFSNMFERENSTFKRPSMDLAAARITMSLGTADLGLGAVEDGDLVSLSGKSGWLESRQVNIKIRQCRQGCQKGSVATSKKGSDA